MNIILLIGHSLPLLEENFLFSFVGIKEAFSDGRFYGVEKLTI